MLEKITLADMEKVAGRIAVLARELGLIAPDDVVILNRGNETMGINWGISVRHNGQGGHSNTLDLQTISKYRREAYNVIAGYHRALEKVSYMADVAARQAAKVGE